MKKWLYFLLDDQGRSYKNDNGTVKAVAQPTPLPQTPDGWQDVSIGWERNMNRFGIIRNFSVPLGFVKTANYILRTLALTGTTERKLFLLIKNLAVETTSSTFRFIYRYFYKGELDLTTAELAEEKSTVSIMEGGLSKALAANENTVYEFPLNDPEAIDVYTNGFAIKVTANYKAIPQTPNNLDYIFPLAYLKSDSITDQNIIHQSEFFEDNLSTLVGSANFFFRTDPERVRQFRIYGEFKINNTAGINRNFGIQIRSETATYYAPGAISYAPGQHTITFDQTITIPLPVVEPESFFIFIVPGQASVAIEESELFVEYIYRVLPTNTKAFKPSVLFKKLVGKITGNEADAASDLFAANDSIVVTSGDALRGIADAVVKTSLKDFFESYNCWHNVGLSVEDKKIRIEEKSRYFNAATTPFSLGEAKALRLSPAADLQFNVLKTGYQEQSYDYANGRFEFNNTSSFTTPVGRIARELSLIAPYRADPTGVETMRINLEGKTTTDSSNDNDVFVLSINLSSQNVDGSYNLSRPAFDSFQGIPTESQSSIFNIDLLTPKRILKKHGNWIRSVLNGFEEERLKFQTTQKNRELRTVLGSVLIDEDIDELIGNLDAPLFKPWYIEFECQSPVNIVDALEANPNQPFSFTWDGNTFTGFLMKAGIAPDTNKEQTIKLLAAPDTDLTKLI